MEVSNAAIQSCVIASSCSLVATGLLDLVKHVIFLGGGVCSRRCWMYVGLTWTEEEPRLLSPSLELGTAAASSFGSRLHNNRNNAWDHVAILAYGA